LFGLSITDKLIEDHLENQPGASVETLPRDPAEFRKYQERQHSPVSLYD
jgi:hypothetical protein